MGEGKPRVKLLEINDAEKQEQERRITADFSFTNYSEETMGQILKRLKKGSDQKLKVK